MLKMFDILDNMPIYPETTVPVETVVSPELINGANARFEQVALNAAAIGRVAYACGVPEGTPSSLLVFASTEPMERESFLDLPGSSVVLKSPVFAQHEHAGTAYVYMGSVANALEAPSPTPPKDADFIAQQDHQDALKRHEQTRTHANDVSGELVEAISHTADYLTMGPQDLREERKKAERHLKLRAFVPRAAAAVLATGVTVAGAVLNHRFNTLPALPVDGVAGVFSVASWILAWRAAADKGLEQYLIRHNFRMLPADIRAREHATAYREARSAGEIGNLVTYELRRKTST